MRGRRWLLWAVGLLGFLAIGLAVADPAIWFFVLDPELLAILAANALIFVRRRYLPTR